MKQCHYRHRSSDASFVSWQQSETLRQGYVPEFGHIGAPISISHNSTNNAQWNKTPPAPNMRFSVKDRFIPGKTGAPTREQGCILRFLIPKPAIWISLFAAVLSSALFVGAADSKTNATSLLTIERIFNSSELNAKDFGKATWDKEGKGYMMLESVDQEPGQSIVWYDAATGNKEVIIKGSHFIPPGSQSPLYVENYTFSEDRALLLIFTNSKRVWRSHTRGDYWVLDVSSRELKKLGGDAKASTLMFATFSPNGNMVAYVRENNLYVEDLGSCQITQLTRDGSSNVINGTFDWVYEEELSLRHGFRWSPDSSRIAFWRLDTAGMKEYTMLTTTDGLYPRSTVFKYPKAGEMNASCTVGVISAKGGKPIWLQTPGDPRNHYLARMEWIPQSDKLLLQQLNRLQNTNKVMVADTKTGQTTLLFAETDAAWVDAEETLYWIKSGEQFLWFSERSGWRQVYQASLTNGSIRCLTPGNYDVIDIQAVDEADNGLYFTASPDDPTCRYLYRVPLSGGEKQRISPAGSKGTHSYQISPGGHWAVHTFSSFAVPPVIQLVKLPGHESVRVFESNAVLRAKLGELKRGDSEFFRVDIGNDVELDGWRMMPPSLDPKQKYPVLFYVYGEPAGQTVLNQWQGRNYFWHLMLTQQGYMVMSIDNRGTPAPRGRDWRKSIYRQVGILASADQAAAVRTIARKFPYMDAKKTAIWGWSGGGSMTLNALFRYPEVYHTGMAIAFVSNERYYDTIYQERYMGLPRDNVDGYKNGSPITFAHQLKGNLLLVHGTGDDNVHYQNAEALVNELVANNKPFSMMMYPNRSHGISEGRNTTPHLFETLTRFLNEKMPARGLVSYQKALKQQTSTKKK